MVTDIIILDLYKAFPENFIFFGDKFQVPRFVNLDDEGCDLDIYTLIGDPAMKGFHVHKPSDPGYQALRRQAERYGEIKAFNAAYGGGPLGEGVYMAGLEHPVGGERPKYIRFLGDLQFFYNYRGKLNYPLPPFEEIKYYKDSTVTQPMVNLLVDRLKCFKVDPDFADYLGQYISDAAVDTETNIGSLNEWLMFFSGVQVPQNFDSVMTSVSDYERNLLPLFNGKSSHLFIDFDAADFDFAKNTFEADSKYALYEAARTSREFSPAHAITRVNLNASAEDSFTNSDSSSVVLGFDKDDTREKYSSNSILSNFESDGVEISFATGGGDDNRGSDDGRGGLNTFKRGSVRSITGPYLSGTTTIAPATVPRRALRRRNYKYVLPKEGYYDRTGFNAPNAYDASVLENSLPNSLGELTLGYVASAGKFFPVKDPINPSGVWDICEGYNSTKTFSGVDSSTTFPYRGLYSITSVEDKYFDRGQVPKIYVTMHEMLEQKALDYAQQEITSASSSFVNDDYWKNNAQSFANLAIASGLVFNSREDYDNFSFGVGPHKLFKDFKKYFNEPLSPKVTNETGPGIISHVFASGLYNCDLSLGASLKDELVASSVIDSSAINVSSVWFAGATGTTTAVDQDDSVVPLTGTYADGSFNAEFRNAEILSGIEFCDISGAPSANEFRVFNLDKSFAVDGKENYLINNPVIKCKSTGGLPRLRFDLSSYGPRRNYFIKDHKFKLDVRALVAEERSPGLGGGSIGVWIHTQPRNGYFWTWTPNGKWSPMKSEQLSIQKVLDISHKYMFPNELPEETDKEYCLNNILETSSSNDVLTLNNIKKDFFKEFTVEFDTRNFTENNNFEYLDIIPLPEEFYRELGQVHRDDTNYIVEIFFLPTSNQNKYLLIDHVKLQDKTARDRAGIGTGHGVATKNIPLTPFVKEDKLEFNKSQLLDVLKFYNSLIGEEQSQYTTVFSSRDAALTSGIMELSGGSRLSYRVQPEWGTFQKDVTHENYTEVEFDNR